MMTTEEKGLSLRVELFLIIVIGLLVGCLDEEEIPPSGLIPEEEFVEVLVDLNLIEAVRTMHINKENQDKAETEEFYNELWVRKAISRDSFITSFDYYRKDSKKMSELYKKVSESIKRKEDLLNAKKQKQAEEFDQR